VGAVVVFEEDTPLALIEALRPDVLVKGGDYAVSQIVGADWVVAHGGAWRRSRSWRGARRRRLVEAIRRAEAEER
jgi:D-beta-D-heptose 7-phosphate kinase/D-beta-D-heptose 1-phosphate adenosyltransferase